MGSSETKFWNKRWISIKQSLKLNSKQRAVVIGSLLGDGTMRIGHDAKNANFKVEHGLKQKAYVEWKYQILKSFVFTKPKLSYRYTARRKKYAKSWWFRTIRHVCFTEIYKSFYLRNSYRVAKKHVPLYIEKELSPLALAVWIMDDGSYNKRGIDISTYSFKLDDIHSLQDCLYKLFGIESTYYSDRGKGYRMYFRVDATQALIQIIRPYIMPSMMYKIGFKAP